MAARTTKKSGAALERLRADLTLAEVQRKQSFLTARPI